MNNITSLDKKQLDNIKQKYYELYKGNQKIIVTAEWDADYSIDQITALENAEEEYKSIISSYNSNCIAVQEGFDNVPVCSFFSAISWLMALAYGCDLLKINGLVNAAPRFYNVKDAFKLQRCEKIYNYGLYPIITERIMEFQRRWGDVPITISDNQSPIDVVTTIMHSEEAMLAMYDEGEAIHHLLNIVTGSVIEVNRFLESIINNFAGFLSGVYLPFGMHISDDDAAFLSPNFYKEYAKPYSERLSDEFGGIAFHCCMGHAQNLENFASTKGFIGFDAMPDYNPMDKVLSAIDKKGVWSVYNYPFAKRDNRTETDEETFKRIIDQTVGKCGLFLIVYEPKKDDALRLAQKVKDYAVRLGRV